MIAADADAAAATSPPDAGQRESFFRQSGWLMIASIGGGMVMWLVHFLSKKIAPGEYGLFVTYLAVAMCIPTMPLQMALAQQTAQALATDRRRQLAGMIRAVALTTFVGWLVAALAFWFLRNDLMLRWEITNSAGLWITVGVILFSLWAPMLAGVLQGRQNFLWLGWCQLLNGLGRLMVAAVVVLALAGGAAGMMSGVLVGMLAATVISLWQTRDLWGVEPLPFDWRGLLKQIIPPMLGFGAFQFLFTADTLYVKSYFTAQETGFYASAGTLSRALMWLVGPLAAVMFPRIVHSAAKSEKNDLMNIVLLGTAILAITGAIALSILGPWVVRIVNGAQYVAVASQVLPWYAGAMVPLALANVLLNNLLARSCYRIVPLLCVLACGYAFALTRFHDSLVMVLKTVGAFNLGLLLICLWGTWDAKRRAAM